MAGAFDTVFVLALLCVSSVHLPLGKGTAPPITSAILSPSVSFAEETNCSENMEGSCPLGLYCYQGQCQCRNYPGGVARCEGADLLVLKSFCITFDDQERVMLMGACSYTSFRKSAFSYIPFYRVESGTENRFCSTLNKMGILCGQCLPDFSPLAYSFNMTCVPCPHPRWNWLWYIMAAYLPLTLFYLVIILFHVNTMSGHIHAAIIVSQAVSMSIMTRLVTGYLEHFPYSVAIVAKMILSLYGIWNLDFFRPFYSNLCLGIDILPTLALDYAIAVYPLLLMVVSYLLIALHDRNYRVVTVPWSPFRRLFSLFRRNWDIKSTLVDAFVTFFFLSNTKFLTVSFDLLVPTKIYHISGINYTVTYGLYYSADIEYFGEEHLPYALLAMIVTFVFVIFPVALLALYPFRFFQKFLNLFPFRWYILHTFMDSFLGCYRDGTQPGTRGCRISLALVLLFRMLALVVYAFTLSAMTYVIVGLLLMMISFIVMAMKPFKTPPAYSNVSYAAYLQLLAFLYVVFAAVTLGAYGTINWLWFLEIVSLLALCLPLVDAFCVFTLFVVRRRRNVLQLITCCFGGPWSSSNGYEELLDGGGGEGGEEVVSDRIRNPNAYPQCNLSRFASSVKEAN